MSWSVQLWDRFDGVSAHTVKGIESLERFGNFIKDRCAVELDYASRLRKLTKCYDIKRIKENNSDKEYTHVRAFHEMLQHLNGLATQHETIAENLVEQIAKEIQTICKEAREERKKYMGMGVELQNSLTASLARLDKSKKVYQKAFKESQKALELYKKADDNYYLSRAEVEKAKTMSLIKERAYEDSKTEYARQLQDANEAQRKHFSDLMPRVFDQLQALDTRRIESTRNYMKLSATIEKDVIPAIEKHLDEVVDTANTIDPLIDNQIVVEKYKSNLEPPNDIEFEDLVANKDSFNSTSNNQLGQKKSKSNSLMCKPSLRSASFRHTLSARGFRKKINLFSANADKGNGQNVDDDKTKGTEVNSRKDLIDKIGLLNEQISQKEKSKDVLLSKRQALKENNLLDNDPEILSIDNQLKNNQTSILQLNEELKRNLVLLEAANSLAGNKKTGTSTNHDNEAISRSSGISHSQSVTSSNGPESERSSTDSHNSSQVDSSHPTEGSKSSATYRTSRSFDGSVEESLTSDKPTVPDR